MTNPTNQPNNSGSKLSKQAKPNWSTEECVLRAKEILSEQSQCLLLFDVIGSAGYDDPQAFTKRLRDMMSDLNQEFTRFFPPCSLATNEKEEHGFEVLLGDGSWAGINSSEAIPQIRAYLAVNYPELNLRWAVAKDGYDPIFSLVK